MILSEILATFQQVYFVSVIVGVVLLGIDIGIVVYGRRWTYDDTSGSLIIFAVVCLPLVNLVMIGWLIGDIIKEIKKGVHK